MSILLLYPPVAKLSEPPAGIARLAGTLREHGVGCRAVDLNLLCMLDLFTQAPSGEDTWSRRAAKSCRKHLDDLRSSGIYRNSSRYRRAVNDLNRVISRAVTGSDCEISLANYGESARSPLKSADLLQAADQYSDNRFFPLFSKRLDTLIASEHPRFIGISFSYLSQALTGFAIAGFIKRRYPGLPIIAGGGLVTSWMNNPHWSEPFSGLIDICVKGPGEQELLGLFGQEQIGGWGTPDYEDFSNNRYLSPGFILPYAASDGCYWKKCTFCPDMAEDTPYIQTQPDRAGEQIRKLGDRYRPVLLHLLDNALSPGLLASFVDKPPGLPWYGFSRFESDLEDPEFCRNLRKCGCVMLKLGLESGSQHVLERMHKGIELDRVSRILLNLRSAGISTYVYLLFGTPSETEDDARLTMELVRRHHDGITFLNLAIFNMPVCSPEAAANEHRFSDGDLSLYCDFTHPAGWDRKKVRTFLQKQFRRDPLINTIIQRDPPFFTSNHAPFFCPSAAAPARPESR